MLSIVKEKFSGGNGNKVAGETITVQSTSDVAMGNEGLFSQPLSTLVSDANTNVKTS